MRIEELLNKKQLKNTEGKSIFVRLRLYKKKLGLTEELYFGKVIRSGKMGLFIRLNSGAEVSFPPQDDAVREAAGEVFTLSDGKEVRPELYAEFSVYSKDY